MRALAQDLFVVERPQRFLGLELGTRMTVMRVDGDLLLHAPVAVDPRELETHGNPRWLLAPNRFHHLHVGPWLDHGIRGWAAPGLGDKRPDLAFDAEVADTCEPWGDAVQLIPTRSLPLVSEVALLHRPSCTLVLTDLVFHLEPEAPCATRAAMRCAWGYPGCRSTLLERVFMDRVVAREEIGGLLALDFDRLVMAHGRVIETGGRDALAAAYRWLGV